jgi:hypothetical protein
MVGIDQFPKLIQLCISLPCCHLPERTPPPLNTTSTTTVRRPHRACYATSFLLSGPNKILAPLCSLRPSGVPLILPFQPPSLPTYLCILTVHGATMLRLC